MTSAAFAMPDDSRQRVSIRRRTTTNSTSTSAAADEALQYALDRRLRKREGRLPPPRRQAPLGGAPAAVAASVNRLGWPQWLFRAAMLGFVAVVLGFAVVAAVPAKDGRRGFAVAGTVLLNGRPLTQAVLEFHGTDAGGPFVVCLDTNEAGAFRRPASAGIPAGTYAVVVKSGCTMPNPRAERGIPVRIPPKYTAAQSTPLKVEVNRKESTFDIVLR